VFNAATKKTTTYEYEAGKFDVDAFATHLMSTFGYVTAGKEEL